MWKYNHKSFKFFRFFMFLALTTTAIFSIPDSPALVKAVPSVYLRRLSPTTTYESSIPLFFKISVQAPAHAKEESKCDSGNPGRAACEIASLIRMMVHKLREDLLTYEAIQQDISKVRNPRQIGIALAAIAGFAMRPIVSKLTNGLFGGDQDVENYINKVRDSLAKTDKRVVHMQYDLHEFSNSVQKGFDEITANLSSFSNQVDANLISIMQLLVTKIDTDRLHDTLTSCQNRFIPSQILPHKVLLERLTKLEADMKNQKYELAIPVTRLAEYLKLPLADCMFSENFAWVMINVPIRQMGSDWILFEILHSKFAFQGQTCEIYPKDVSYLAVDGSKTVIVNSHILRHCSVSEHGICLIPPHARDSSQSLECSVGMLGGKSVEELSKVCAFRCHTNTELIISQLEHNKVLVTNAEIITFVCTGSKSKSYTFEMVGAVEVTLKCDCVVYANKEPIPPPFPCVHDEDGFRRPHEIYHVLPDLWTSLHSAVGLYGQHVHNDHKQILLDDWNTRVPIFNFSVPLVNDIKEELGLPDHFEAYRGPWYIQYVLFGTLLLLLSILSCVICCFCRSRKD